MDTFEPTIEYRDIPGFPGYRIGTDGSVWSSRQLNKGHRGQWHRLHIRVTNTRQHLSVSLQDSVTKRGKTRFIHSILLEAFVGPRPPGMLALHKNDIPHDNRLDNLYWGTESEQARDRVTNRHLPRGKAHPNGKLSDDDVRAIRLRSAHGDSRRTLARAFHVTYSHIGNILSRRDRGDVQD